MPIGSKNSIMTNWKEIHPEFTEELVKEWTSNGFTYEQTKKLVVLGLEPTDSNYAQWLKNWRWEKKEDKPTDILSRYGKEILKKEYEEYLTKNLNSVYHPSNHARTQKNNIINAQEWLDKNYPKENRNKFCEIYLNEPSLEGELDLRDFISELFGLGVQLYISSQVDETKLIFKNKPEKVEIIKLVDAQEWLENQTEYNTKRKKVEVTELYIRKKSLEGNLNLNDFINLEVVDCSLNKLTRLDLINCEKLEEINCSGNLLTSLDVINCPHLIKLDCSFHKLTNLTLPTNLTNLKELDLSHNNFNQDLSFLKKSTSLEKLKLGDNRFTGSLDYLSSMHQLKELSIDNTDLNEVNLDKLPRSLWKIEYSTYRRPNCKLTEIVSSLDKCKFMFCQKCLQPNTSSYWCQPCAEKGWQQDLKQLTGQELVERFIQQYKNEYFNLQWIPHEEFTNVEYLAEGGFSKVYRAKCDKYKSYKNPNGTVVLKSLNNSQNMTSEFLTEIINAKLTSVTDNVVYYYGISQDPITMNYLMVMVYKKSGNLRQVLQKRKLTLEDKLKKLDYIAGGLISIHFQNLVHKDFHSGNILNDDSDYFNTHITDLGLSRPVNYQKQTGEIFGVLPYVAPEVLQSKTYTQASDIYSFGIIAYELFANAYPYYEYEHDVSLAVKIIGDNLRPNIDEIKLPQLLKNLIKRCWDEDPKKRPTAREIQRTLWDSSYSTASEKNNEFHQQIQEIKAEYNYFSQNTPYKVHSTAITTSELIDTNRIIKLISSRISSLDLSKTVQIYDNYRSAELDFDIKTETKPVVKKDSYQTEELKFGIETPTSAQELTKRLRSMSMENKQEATKSVKLDTMEKKELQEEPMEITENDSVEQIECQTHQEISPK